MSLAYFLTFFQTPDAKATFRSATFYFNLIPIYSAKKVVANIKLACFKIGIGY